MAVVYEGKEQGVGWSAGSGAGLGALRIMSDEQRALCLGRSICDVPRATTATVDGGQVGASASAGCIRAIFDKKAVGDLQKECSFTCQPYTQVLVTHVENNK